jgi:hypothetical protein
VKRRVTQPGSLYGAARMFGVPPTVRVGAWRGRLRRPLRSIMLALLADPGREWLARDLVRVSGLAEGRVYAPLQILLDAGWLKCRRTLADAVTWQGSHWYQLTDGGAAHTRRVLGLTDAGGSG